MARKTRRICPQCGIEFEADIRNKTCSRVCTDKLFPKVPSQETREKISKKIKELCAKNKFRVSKEDSLKYGIKGTKGKYNENPKSLLTLSRRTVTKILDRLEIGCSRCGWNEGRCDIHHINGKKIEDPHNHNNLSVLCPNCHRLAHEKKIDKNSLISLVDYIGNEWKKFYYG